MSELKGHESEGKSSQVQCAECDRTTNHLVVCAVAEDHLSGDGYEVTDILGRSVFQIVRCMGCNTVSFRRVDINYESNDVDSQGDPIYDEIETLFPPRHSDPAHDANYLGGDFHRLPGDIQRVYRETAQLARLGMVILVGVGVRSVVEAACVDQKVPGHDLSEMIDALVTDSHITAGDASILHQIRNIGNKATHRLNALSEAQVRAAMSVVDNLLRRIYVLPIDAAVLPPVPPKKSKPANSSRSPIDPPKSSPEGTR